MVLLANGRNRRFNLMMSTEEIEMLEELAEERGVTASDVIRMALRDAYALRKGSKKTKR